MTGGEVAVLNGTVSEGDTIAYAVSHSSSVTMNVGTVLSLGERELWGGRKVVTLKVRVDKSSSTWSLPRTVTLDHLDRVVKL